METIASAQQAVVPLSGRRPHGGRAAPFLPMSRGEMTALGWSECDIVLVTGDPLDLITNLLNVKVVVKDGAVVVDKR